MTEIRFGPASCGAKGP